MKRTSRWARNGGITLLVALGLGLHAWSEPPTNSMRERIKTITLAPTHYVATRNLERAWKDRLENTQDTAAAREVLNNQVLPLQNNTPTRISLDTYRQEVQQVIDNVYTHTNWEYLQNRFSLSDERAFLAKTLATELDADMLVAIGLAENTPRIPQLLYQRIKGTDLERRVGPLLLDARLRLFGKEIVNLALSRHDKEVSYGLWQKTARAVNSSPDSLGGASIASLALPDSLRLPSRVEYLRGTDHPKSAVLMHEYNVFRTIKNLDDKAFTLLAKHPFHPEVQRAFQLMHHAPTRGENALKQLLLDDLQRPLRFHAENTLRNYIGRLELYGRE